MAVERPAKRAKLLDEDSDDGADTSNSEPLQNAPQFKINKEYARRFEHNKKREEKQRLEEKFGAQPSDSESSSEDDDDGDLGDPELDAQFTEALKALKSKDPRVRDKNYKFFSDITEDGQAKQNGAKKEKPMTLKDYHRRNLLEGKMDVDEEEDAAPKTYAEEQEDLKNTVVKQMHAAAEEEGSGSDDEDDDFLVRKEKPSDSDKKKPRSSKQVELDVVSADRDPETFLSNFISSRAWADNDGVQWQPFDSDDEDGEGVRQADEFEEAYNMRFENPEKANEKLMAFSRETIAKYSVRREEPTGRKKARELEKQRKEEERREREAEKARLRKLKIEEMEQKVNKIRQSAGLRGKDFNLNEWTDVLEADWDDDKWEAEMKRRFGEDYYAAEDAEFSEEEVEVDGKKKRKIKKPTWDDDIDIKDIVPDFDEEEEAAPFSLSDEDGNARDGNAVEDGMDVDEEDGAEDEEEAGSGKRNSKKDRLRAKAEAKKSAKRDRRIIESLVDQNLNLDIPNLPTSSKKSKQPTRFRYRETSPNTFGLTPRDILLATDSQLNQYAGLKKMATFRDPELKKKDKKKLGKKARLRLWRKETFGDVEEPKGGFERILKDVSEGDAPLPAKPKGVEKESAEVSGEKSKKRKRSKKGKAATKEE